MSKPHITPYSKNGVRKWQVSASPAHRMPLGCGYTPHEAMLKFIGHELRKSQCVLHNYIKSGKRAARADTKAGRTSTGTHIEVWWLRVLFVYGYNLEAGWGTMKLTPPHVFNANGWPEAKVAGADLGAPGGDQTVEVDYAVAELRVQADGPNPDHGPVALQYMLSQWPRHNGTGPAEEPL